MENSCAMKGVSAMEAAQETEAAPVIEITGIFAHGNESSLTGLSAEVESSPISQNPAQKEIAEPMISSRPTQKTADTTRAEVLLNQIAQEMEAFPTQLEIPETNGDEGIENEVGMLKSSQMEPDQLMQAVPVMDNEAIIYNEDPRVAEVSTEIIGSPRSAGLGKEVSEPMLMSLDKEETKWGEKSTEIGAEKKQQYEAAEVSSHLEFQPSVNTQFDRIEDLQAMESQTLLQTENNDAPDDVFRQVGLLQKYSENRLQIEVQRVAAIKIQKIYCGYCSRKTKRLQIEVQRLAATVVQRTYRGYFSRKPKSNERDDVFRQVGLLEKYSENRIQTEVQRVAAILIQRIYRGYFSRKTKTILQAAMGEIKIQDILQKFADNRIKREVERIGATLIQKIYRGHSLRNDIRIPELVQKFADDRIKTEVMRIASTLVQKDYRGYFARKTQVIVLEDLGEIKIRDVLKSFAYNREQNEVKRLAARRIQALYRGFYSRKHCVTPVKTPQPTPIKSPDMRTESDLETTECPCRVPDTEDAGIMETSLSRKQNPPTMTPQLPNTNNQDFSPEENELPGLVLSLSIHEIYDPSIQKEEELKKKRLEESKKRYAALKIQALCRGWLLRNLMRRLEVAMEAGLEKLRLNLNQTKNRGIDATPPQNDELAFETDMEAVRAMEIVPPPNTEASGTMETSFPLKAAAVPPEPEREPVLPVCLKETEDAMSTSPALTLESAREPEAFFEAEVSPVAELVAATQPREEKEPMLPSLPTNEAEEFRQVNVNLDQLSAREAEAALAVEAPPATEPALIMHAVSEKEEMMASLSTQPLSVLRAQSSLVFDIAHETAPDSEGASLLVGVPEMESPLPGYQEEMMLPTMPVLESPDPSDGSVLDPESPPSQTASISNTYPLTPSSMNVRIQTALRHFADARMREEVRGIGATRVQAITRGWLCRRKTTKQPSSAVLSEPSTARSLSSASSLPRIRAALQQLADNRMASEVSRLAASRIQAHFRGHKWRMAAKGDGYVIKLQAAMRKHTSHRMKNEVERIAATKIQAAWRGHSIVKRLTCEEEGNGHVLRLQASMRKHANRRIEAEIARMAATKIQAALRGQKARAIHRCPDALPKLTLPEPVLSPLSTPRIQLALQKFADLRMEFEVHRLSAIRIQAHMRGANCRLKLSTQSPMKNVETPRSVTFRIQKALQKFAQKRMADELFRIAATRIQAVYRGWKVRREVRDKLNPALHELRIQAKLRNFLYNRIGMEVERVAATRIQIAVRNRLARRSHSAPLLSGEVDDEEIETPRSRERTLSKTISVPDFTGHLEVGYIVAKDLATSFLHESVMQQGIDALKIQQAIEEKERERKEKHFRKLEKTLLGKRSERKVAISMIQEASESDTEGEVMSEIHSVAANGDHNAQSVGSELESESLQGRLDRESSFNDAFYAGVEEQKDHDPPNPDEPEETSPREVKKSSAMEEGNQPSGTKHSAESLSSGSGSNQRPPGKRPKIVSVMGPDTVSPLNSPHLGDESSLYAISATPASTSPETYNLSVELQEEQKESSSPVECLSDPHSCDRYDPGEDSYSLGSTVTGNEDLEGYASKQYERARNKVLKTMESSSSTGILESTPDEDSLATSVTNEEVENYAKRYYEKSRNRAIVDTEAPVANFAWPGTIEVNGTGNQDTDSDSLATSVSRGDLQEFLSYVKTKYSPNQSSHSSKYGDAENTARESDESSWSSERKEDTSEESNDTNWSTQEDELPSQSVPLPSSEVLLPNSNTFERKPQIPPELDEPEMPSYSFKVSAPLSESLNGNSGKPVASREVEENSLNGTSDSSEYPESDRKAQLALSEESLLECFEQIADAWVKGMVKATLQRYAIDNLNKQSLSIIETVIEHGLLEDSGSKSDCIDALVPKVLELIEDKLAVDLHTSVRSWVKSMSMSQKMYSCFAQAAELLMGHTALDASSDVNASQLELMMIEHCDRVLAHLGTDTKGEIFAARDIIDALESPPPNFLQIFGSNWTAGAAKLEHRYIPHLDKTLHESEAWKIHKEDWDIRSQNLGRVEAMAPAAIQVAEKNGLECFLKELESSAYLQELQDYCKDLLCSILDSIESDESNFEKIQMEVVQHFAANILKRTFHMKKPEQVAIQIQSLWRGHYVRAELRKCRLEEAATAIQALWRGHRARRRKKKQAKVMIDECFDASHQAALDLKVTDTAATLIQATWRGSSTRSKQS